MPGKRVLHLSDLHLTGTGVDEDGVDARASLAQLLGDLRFVDARDLGGVSGDGADDGSPAGYRMAAELVGGFARRRGVPLVHCTGNHDDRAAFAAVLGSGHLDATGHDVGVLAAPVEARAAVSEHDGLRVVTLDSLVPGAAHGVLSDTQLAWLRTVLLARAPFGTLVVLQHPPIAVPGVAAHRDGLVEPASLADAITGSDVRAVLCGHLHHQMSGAVGGVPVARVPGRRRHDRRLPADGPTDLSHRAGP